MSATLSLACKLSRASFSLLNWRWAAWNHFLPFNNLVIYLRVERTAGLLAARRVLLDTLGPDKDRHYTPHLTLTMRLDKQRTQTLLNELRQSEWHTGRWSVPMDHLWLMQRGPHDPAWRYIYRIDLTGQAQ